MGVFLGNLTIALNESNSSAISGRILRTVKSVMIVAPAALDGTVTIQIPDDITSSPTWVPLTRPSGSAGGHVDITIASSKAIILSEVPAHGIRVSSAASEDPAKVFPVFGEEK
ncbi:hypothetical protein LCGC14_3114230 [marine sediment metagenome]|uniref:Uncharacterized protein n=1 Tax=marine sediment metagenome TaxID=412755 RepID=A0A0F8YU49_9ZZZZ